jgi:penicillin V acylase-like amidase (Ntn superfamily)
MHQKKGLMKGHIKRAIAISAAAVVLVAASWNGGRACSRVLWKTEHVGVFAARSLDWHEIITPVMMTYPRGMKLGGEVGDNSAAWTSKYGSLVVNGANYDGIAIDGMNEKGLTAHLLYLDATDYEKRDSRPGVSYLYWLRYVLDNNATVAEALASLETIQVVPVLIHGKIFGTHVAIEDPSGDSAILEFIHGKMVVHHGPQYRVMTNDPPYAIAIKELRQYQTFGGSKPIPGNIESIDRFVRAEYYLKYLPQPSDWAQGVAFIFQVIHTVAVPFGAPYKSGPSDTYPTWWLSAADLTNRVYYFNVTDSPNVIWVDVSALDFSTGRSVMRLDANNPALVGDVSRGFAPVPSK